MLQGDVMAVVAVLIGSCLSGWALTVAYALLFPARSELAKIEINEHPFRCIVRGLVVVLTFGVAGVLLASAAPNPPVKALGWSMVLSILAVAALGMAGIALSAGERLRKMAPDLSPYGAFCRGAAFLIVGCVLPVVGWLAFGPVLYLAAIGAGWRAAFRRGVDRPVLVPAESA